MHFCNHCRDRTNRNRTENQNETDFLVQGQFLTIFLFFEVSILPLNYQITLLFTEKRCGCIYINLLAFVYETKPEPNRNEKYNSLGRGHLFKIFQKKFSIPELNH
jgi:hypothetical protein